MKARSRHRQGSSTESPVDTANRIIEQLQSEDDAHSLLELFLNVETALSQMGFNTSELLNR